MIFDNDYRAEMMGRVDDLFELKFSEPVLDVLDQIGHMPLPPYIDRSDTDEDKSRYQTVYAQQLGAVAAPTAGLHFDDQMLGRIKAKGAQIAFVTLHVGAGTFQPVRVDNILEHKMHSEWLQVSDEVCRRCVRLKLLVAGLLRWALPVCAVLRLRSRAVKLPFEGDTDIFIYPGYQFNVVDALLTNFHLSESTLLMLVSAFSGYQSIMHAYKEAVAERYRFFSYGDAMFLINNPNAAKDIPQ